MNKILLIDGNSIMYRAYYGLSSSNMLSTKEGVFTNAIFGFLNTMEKFIEIDRPTHICVAFDLKEKSFRNDLFKDYKAGRKPMPEELVMQFPLIKEILRIMNIKTVQMEGQEADDLIGTLKRSSEEQGFDVVILTGDRDMIQLSSEKTTVKIPTVSKGKNIVNEYTLASLKEEMGISASEYIHVKALMGDKSDNIPGVAGIGEKTALALIGEYKSLDNLYEHIDEIKSDSVRTKLIIDKENAYLSLLLSAINLFSPMTMDFDDYRIIPYDKSELFDLFTKLEFNYFIKKYDLKPQPAGIHQLHVTDVTELGQIEFSEDICVFMTEDLFTFTFDGDVIYKTNDFRLLKEIFSKVKNVSGHYLKNLFVYLFKNNIDIPKVTCDTATIAYLLDATKDYYDLDEIYDKYCEKSFEQPYSEPAKIYQLRTLMLDKIKSEGMERLLKDIEHPLIEVLAYLEFIGFKADIHFLEEFSARLQTDIDSIEKSVYEMAGSEFNINSPKQLGKVLFEDMNLPHGKKNKTGYSTSVEILEKLAVDYDIAQYLITYRQLTKLKSTYADGLIRKISPVDGRIHSSFNQTVAATGRISSTEPNLQNIPIRSELGREIRKAFTCENDDYLLVSADYSQIELRILADLSEDEILIDAFINGDDIHTKTAAKVFGVDERMVTKEMRRAAKAVNFGIIYGISDFGLSRDLKIPVSTAKAYIEQYFREYRKVKKYMDGIIDFAIKNGYVTTIFNRRRIIRELESSNYMQREFGKRVALNTPIQGSSADIIKLAMNKIYYILKERKLKSRLILQIHDELIIEAHVSEIDLIRDLLTECMKDAFTLKVPLEIEISSGRTLYET